MRKFLLSDRFWGILLTLFVVGCYFHAIPFVSTVLETVELKFYDFRARSREDPVRPSDIAIVSIDDDSLNKVGRWPWPRSVMADMVTQLNSYGPKVIGVDVFFSEPQSDPGLAELNQLESRYKELLSSKAVTERDSTSPVLSAIDASRKKLDDDAKLAAALQGKNVVLPITFDLHTGLGGKLDPLPADISRLAMTKVMSGGNSDAGVGSEKVLVSLLPAFSSAAAGIGDINVVTDSDGSVRATPIAVSYGDAVYPSYALEILRVYLGLEPKNVTIAPAQKVSIGNIEVPLDSNGLMNVTYRGPEGTFFYYPFYDVMTGKVSADHFKDKIVLIGGTALGAGDHYVTPVGTVFPGVELEANVIENLLKKNFLMQPPWAFSAELGLILLVGLFVSFVLPRLKAGMGAIVASGILVIVVGVGWWLFVAQNEWLRFSYPAVLLAAGYTVIVSKRFLTTEKRKELVEASQIETSKMLGLSFQGQGMLDLAFEKFRACPLDETISDLLYNLGLDFERKRQYNKAVAVYEYIGTKFKNYKDTAAKQETLRKASDGAVFGGSVGRSKDSTIMTEGAGMKPTLGRYEVEKELGRGAMGIVYLGKDPKINRQVAIKTMMLELEGTPDQVKELKMRFFREAESAGNLNHPNIVRIFDAGEESEIAYIAMELLDGHDLKRYCDKTSLLPLETVLDYCAKTADGLDYAHHAGVIHRDIKPANIMLLKDGTLRITDFGIARIAASSKTATGTVMGTPSYMSPEQVSGRKVDGRADLWSLGVMLYEMSTGEKPFKGGDAIGTLLFQIANDPPVSPAAYRSDLPADVVAIIDKCLKKNPDERYQSGSELSADLRKVLERMKSGGPPPKAAKPFVSAAAAPSTSSAPADKTVVSSPAPSSAADKTVVNSTPASASESTLRIDPGPDSGETS